MMVTFNEKINENMNVEPQKEQYEKRMFPDQVENNL